MTDKQQADTPDEVVEEMRTGDTPVWIEADPDLDKSHDARHHAAGSHRRGASGFFTFIALLLAIAAGGGVYYLWEQQKALQPRPAAELQQKDYDTPIRNITTTQSELQQQVNRLQETLEGQIRKQQALQEKVSSLEQQLTALSAQQAQVQEAPSSTGDSTSAQLAPTSVGDNTPAEIAPPSAGDNTPAQPAPTSVGDNTPAEIASPSTGNNTPAPPAIVSASGLPEMELAHVESLLQLAQDRLKLLKDVTTAIGAMELADSQLKPLQNPALEAIRQGIENDIAALRQVRVPDVLSLAREIQGLGEKAQDLPLRSPKPRKLADSATPPDTNTSADTPSGWRGVVKGISRELKPLVAIRRVNPVTPQMLSAEDETLVRQMLQVKLQAASLATLQKNTDGMKYSLQQALDWLTQRYDTENPEVASIVENIRALMQTPLTVELPPTGSALAQLRALIYPGNTP